MPDFEINPVTDHSSVGIEAEFGGGDDFSDVAKTRVREGLPAKFRMRHASHYVEQLMGDAPLQTVRQIPLDQLEGPEVSSDVSDLVASIREVGLLQPLLVVAHGDGRFHVVAGTNRLAAARQAGLRTVPCLIVNADEEAAVRLRAHTGLRSAPEPVAPAPMPPEVAAAADVLRTTLTEISESMRFIDDLIPIARGFEASGRSALIVDTISVEGDRATTLAAAATLFLRSESPALAPVDCLEILNAIRAQVRVAARLRGADVQWASSIRLGQPVADRESLRTGWAALIHAVLGIAQDSDRIEISLTAPRVRPAVILEVTLRRSTGTLPQDPFGPAGAIMMAGARRSAELHGGRLSVRAIDQGLAVTFVVPQPLDLF